MIDMKLKEAIEHILPHYEKAVIEMPKEGHYEWLYNRYMMHGICYFSNAKLSVSIELPFADIVGYHGFLNLQSPHQSNTYEENLQQIQNRVDWMREYLSKN